MANLPMVWTKHLKDDEAKKRLEGAIRNNVAANSRLVDILLEWEQSALRTRKTDYESPSWSHLQAHQNGAAEALRQVIDLFNFMETRS